MIRKKWIASVGIGLITVMMFFGIVSTATVAAEEKLKWRMATVYPRGSDYRECYHGFTEKVRIMSAGRLVIEDIYDGEGVSALEILGAVKTGLIEMGAPYMAFHAGEIPAGLVELGLPGAPVDVIPYMTLLHETEWEKILRKEYARHNIYWLSEYFQAPMMLLTKKPINSLEDLSKMKIRSPGAYGKMLKNLGAAPVVMAFGEVYTALATGVVDGIGGNPFTDLRDGRFYEVAKYVYPLPIVNNLAANLVVNLDHWNKLPDDLKEILEVAGRWHAIDQATKSLLWNQEAFNEMKASGVKWGPDPSKEDKTRWQEAAMKLWPEYAEKDPTSKELIEIQKAFMAKMGM